MIIFDLYLSIAMVDAVPVVAIVVCC